MNSPYIIHFSVNPEKVRPGDIMTVSASIFDPFGVEKVEARFYYENGFDTIELRLSSGSKYTGGCPAAPRCQSCIQAIMKYW